MKTILLTAVLCAIGTPYAHATDLNDIQEELETQQFEADMNHDEEMDALTAKRDGASQTVLTFETCVQDEKAMGRPISVAAGNCMVAFMHYYSWSAIEVIDACTKLTLRKGPLPPATMLAACQASLRLAQKR